MYSKCLFCSGDLGTNEAIEHFPVGRRLAFDAAMGRLWAVCSSCGRWNLTPIEERWEAIEECERRYRGTYVRVSTTNVGLAKLREGLELVRIGSPLRPEFAAWRYASKFAVRRVHAYTVAGAGIAAAAATAVGVGGIAVLLGPALLPVFTGGTSMVFAPALISAIGVVPMVGALAAGDYVKNERVVARFLDKARVATVRAKHLPYIQLHIDSDSRATLQVPHDAGRRDFDGSTAIHATGVLLAGANRYGASESVVRNAVREIEECGNPDGFLRAAATRGGWRRGGRLMSILGGYRQLGVMNMTPTERLALEMSVHEEAERRAMRGELQDLDRAWRDAEEIAAISDGELTPGPSTLGSPQPRAT